MKIKPALLYLLIAANGCVAQNLVDNGNFEQYISCPTNGNQLNYALFWYNPTNLTPDYYNACSMVVGMPVNIAGYQYAHSGNGCGGMSPFHFTVPEYREYMETELTTPLMADSCYHLEMYANLSNLCNKATDAIEVYFTDTLVENVTTAFLQQFTAHIANGSGFVTDTLNWTHITGNYTAHGGESYLIIGNFKDDAHTAYTAASNTNYSYAYYYIDDVSLTKIPACNTGINNLSQNITVTVSANAVQNNITVSTACTQPCRFILYDMAARKMLQHTFTNTATVNAAQLTKGMYLYSIQTPNGLLKNGKLVVE